MAYLLLTYLLPIMPVWHIGQQRNPSNPVCINQFFNGAPAVIEPLSLFSTVLRLIY